MTNEMVYISTENLTMPLSLKRTNKIANEITELITYRKTVNMVNLNVSCLGESKYK
jgi:hypothetical protein